MTSCVVYILEVESFKDLLDVDSVWELEESKKVQLVYALQSKFYDKASTEFLNVSDSYAEVNVQLYVVLKRNKILLSVLSLSKTTSAQFLSFC